jgi:hypothetical protein
MRKQLSIGVALLFAVACKTESAAPAAGGSAGEQPTPTVRSAKIDLKPVRPAAPAAPALPDSPPNGDRDQGGGDRDQWRDRRARIDTDGDGVVTDAERDAAMKARMTQMHARLDTDGDGKVTPAELANARGRMHFDDPAAIDTNHDGEISTDELAAAMKARRDERRGRIGSGSQTTP